MPPTPVSLFLSLIYLFSFLFYLFIHLFLCLFIFIYLLFIIIFLCVCVSASDLCPAVGKAVLGDGVVALSVPCEGVARLLTTVGVAGDLRTVGMT